MITAAFKEWTLDKLDKAFGLNQILATDCEVLKTWQAQAMATDISAFEQHALTDLQAPLIWAGKAWNEVELENKFISPLIMLAKIDDRKMGYFLEHALAAEVGETAMPYPVQSEQFGEEEILGSRNHAYLQTILGAELLKLEQFTVYTELSLDINGKEYKPDIALYPLAQQPQDFLEDELRMTEMPLCAIEILSPRQFMESITDKFKVYFSPSR